MLRILQKYSFYRVGHIENVGKNEKQSRSIPDSVRLELTENINSLFYSNIVVFMTPGTRSPGGVFWLYCRVVQ
jgi:hypothetical protein